MKTPQPEIILEHGTAVCRPLPFIVVRSSFDTYHATLRSSEKPWSRLSSCSNTSGPLSAAEAVLRKSGWHGCRPELVPGCLWQDATNGYLATRNVSAITHIYRLVRA